MSFLFGGRCNIFNKKSVEFNIDEIIVALCYNLGMIEEGNILISELKLIDLKELAEFYLKASKSDNKTIKEKSEKLLIETLALMEKAHNGEIMTPEEFTRKHLSLLGGREGATKLIEDDKRRRDELSKRPKKSDNQ